MGFGVVQPSKLDIMDTGRWRALDKLLVAMQSTLTLHAWLLSPTPKSMPCLADAILLGAPRYWQVTPAGHRSAFTASLLWTRHLPWPIAQAV